MTRAELEKKLALTITQQMCAESMMFGWLVAYKFTSTQHLGSYGDGIKD